MKHFQLTLLALVICAATPLSALEPTPVPLTEIGKKLEAKYSGMLEPLRADLTAKLPKAEPVVEFLASDALDAQLMKCVILIEATPAGLAEFTQQGREHMALVDQLLADADLMKRMLVADGAAGGKYGQAMQIYSAIRKASAKASDGVLERLALATALEHAVPIKQENPKAQASAPATIDPVKRYLYFEKAFLNHQLDPAFEKLSVWELRFVIAAAEPDETLTWGREMLRNFRPDHIHTADEGWRYANLVNTDVNYGSRDVKYDKPELQNAQNILMNGGICGRRAFMARFICRAFGIPATARPSTGHGATTRWTPKGWVIVLGPNWGSGSTTTQYRGDLDFLATTQARGNPEAFLKVKRAYWAGDVMGETRNYGQKGDPSPPAFWSGIALATQKQVIEALKAVALAALGEDVSEDNGASVADNGSATTITPEDKKIIQGTNGVITIPAAAFSKPAANTDYVIAMKSFTGGSQVFLPRFFPLKPVLVRGGSWKCGADLCESATRHWVGRRPKNSIDMRGMRVAVTSEGKEPAKELKLDLGRGVSMELVYIPPGKFIMGGDRTEQGPLALVDVPKHEVTLTTGFYLGKYEVTRAQYKAIADIDPTGPVTDPNHPIDRIRPWDALRFCDELTAKIGMDARLPTEAEWEYAARAGTAGRWFFGDDPSKATEYGWIKDNAQEKSQPVGQKKPNPWGLYDMYGNIGEIVRDAHDKDYYANGPKVDPTGPIDGVQSSMEYTVTVPKAGNYTLTALAATMNEKQTLTIAVNEANSGITMAMPFTVGMWKESAPVTISLKEGENILHFWRDEAPQYGVAVKSFTLRPVSGR